MYGKIFTSMYDGTLRTKWQALVAFQQLIVLADQDGVVDMTVEAIAARTGIPLGVIAEGIEFLEQPDKFSRSPDSDGKRLNRLNQHRPWGWQIVNYAKYRNMRSAEDRREYHRQYYHDKNRNKSRKKLNSAQQSAQHRSTDSTKAEAEVLRTPLPPEGEPRVEGLNLEAWQRFETYRREIRKPVKDASVLASQKKLASFGAAQPAVVEQSIANGWQGLFELKHVNGAATPKAKSEWM